MLKPGTFQKKKKKIHSVEISTTQILRDINGDATSAKSAILAHLEALKFDFY